MGFASARLDGFPPSLFLAETALVSNDRLARLFTTSSRIEN